MRSITPRQIKYLNILLSEAFGENRKLYLKLFYKVDSSRDLSLYQASEIIEKFVPDNGKRDENVRSALGKIYECLGQRKLF